MQHVGISCLRADHHYGSTTQHNCCHFEARNLKKLRAMPDGQQGNRHVQDSMHYVTYIYCNIHIVIPVVSHQSMICDRSSQAEHDWEQQRQQGTPSKRPWGHHASHHYSSKYQEQRQMHPDVACVTVEEMLDIRKKRWRHSKLIHNKQIMGSLVVRLDMVSRCSGKQTTVFK